MPALSDRLVFVSLAFALGAALLAPALARADVPQAPATVFAQVGACKSAYDGVRGVHDFSVRTGTVLWTCGDVPTVTGADMGQEYCEYQAVTAGRSIRNVSDIAQGGSLHCVFTTVFSDTEGKDAKLMDALALPENLGARPDTPAIVRMTRPDNSRKTANAAVQNCSADDSAAAQKTDEIRQVACFQAMLTQPDSEASEKLRDICRGQDLSQEAQWAKAALMGAKVLAAGDEGYDEQRDIASCVATKRLGGGLAWRNSDMRLCARARRASEDCGCSYEAISAAADGFAFSGWTNPILGAVGCRKAKVDGADYDQIVICDIPAAEISDIELNLDFAENLPAFCRERFKNNLPVRADIRSFQKAGSCNDKATPFCTAQAGSAP